MARCSSVPLSLDSRIQEVRFAKTDWPSVNGDVKPESSLASHPSEIRPAFRICLYVARGLLAKVGGSANLRLWTRGNFSLRRSVYRTKNAPHSPEN